MRTDGRECSRIGRPALALALAIGLGGAAALSAGTATVRPGVPSVGGDARFGGNHGLEVDVASPNRNAAYVQSSHASSDRTYRVRFYVNLRGLVMGNGDELDLFVAYDGADPTPPTTTGDPVLRITARGGSGGQKLLTASARLDNGTDLEVPAPISLPDGWRCVEVDWAAATAAGANNGRLALWTDGGARNGLSGLDNDQAVVSYARLGSVTGADPGTSGRFRLDDFVSQRTGYIGPAAVFSDVSTSSSFFPFIQGIYAAEVIPGCTVSSFCPNGVITRKEMARFLLLARYGAGFTPPACTTPMFSDVPCTHPYAVWINELARQGITSGCTATQFCPDGNITRAQMSVFLMVASGVTPAPCPPSMFNDVSAQSSFCPWINEIARRGITAGCGNDNFCPESLVLRGQMAVFLSTTFGLPTHLVGP